MKRPRVGILDGISGAMGGAQLVIAHLAMAFSRLCDVEIIHYGATASLDELRKGFRLPLSGITERLMPVPPNFGKPELRVLSRELCGEYSKLSEGYDLFIYSGHGVPPFCLARQGMVYSHFPSQRKPLDQARGTDTWQSLGTWRRSVRVLAHHALWRYRLARYRCVLANSAFTARWIKARWGIDAEVLYPPVPAVMAHRTKRNLIVTVGRFAGIEKQSKGHLEQVSAFRQFLADTGEKWTLRMFGFCDGAASRVYLDKVRNAARDLPIDILERADRDEVLETLAEAKVFWHTKGLGLTESTNPEGAEHFGIATVEAMRGGCVPVVIASGGQREIVEHGKSGFLCSDLSEMIKATVSLAQQPNLLAGMSEHARERSFDFSPLRFLTKLAGITSKLFPGTISDAAQETTAQEFFGDRE